ncbi:MAG: hypothetical protein WCH04_15870 [Gammaproteobacteria bacterium]
MKWIEILFWSLFYGIAVCALCAFVPALALFWYSTTLLIHGDLQQKYIREASRWFESFLVCGGGVTWLFTQSLHDMPNHPESACCA